MLGIANIQNSCYLNSILQAFSNCPVTREYFLSRKPSLDGSTPFTDEIGALISLIWANRHAAPDPIEDVDSLYVSRKRVSVLRSMVSNLLTSKRKASLNSSSSLYNVVDAFNAIIARLYEEQGGLEYELEASSVFTRLRDPGAEFDSEEDFEELQDMDLEQAIASRINIEGTTRLCWVLFDAEGDVVNLNKEVLETPGVTRFFLGLSRTARFCNQGHIEMEFKRFGSLRLDLPVHAAQQELEDLLALKFADQAPVLSPLSCTSEDCADNSRVDHRILWAPRDVLVIDFERVNSSRFGDGTTFHKVHTPVMLPFILDIAPYVSIPALPLGFDPAQFFADQLWIYRLVTVIQHEGNNVDSGHYTSLCRFDPDGCADDLAHSWIKFDDERVSRISADEETQYGILSVNCELAVYTRMDVSNSSILRNKLLKRRKTLNKVGKFRRKAQKHDLAHLLQKREDAIQEEYSPVILNKPTEIKEERAHPTQDVGRKTSGTLQMSFTDHTVSVNEHFNDGESVDITDEVDSRLCALPNICHIS